MGICDYFDPVVAHNLVIVVPILSVMVVIRLIKGEPLFTWRDAAALFLIYAFEFYIRHHNQPAFGETVCKWLGSNQ